MYVAPIPRSPSTIAARTLAATSAVAIVAGTLGLLVMQHLPAARALDPVTEPLSKYAFTGAGWLFDGAIVVLALGVAAVLASLLLRRLLVARSMAFLSLAACSIGLLIVVVFPDYTAVGGQPTGIGWAHWLGSVAGFAGAPIAAVFVARHHHWRQGCSTLPTVARSLAMIAATVLVGFLAGTAIQWTTSLPVARIGGAVERAMTAIELTVAMVLAGWAWRSCPCRSTAAVGPVSRIAVATAP